MLFFFLWGGWVKKKLFSGEGYDSLGKSKDPLCIFASRTFSFFPIHILFGVSPFKFLKKKFLSMAGSLYKKNQYFGNKMKCLLQIFGCSLLEGRLRNLLHQTKGWGCKSRKGFESFISLFLWQQNQFARGKNPSLCIYIVLCVKTTKERCIPLAL